MQIENGRGCCAKVWTTSRGFISLISLTAFLAGRSVALGQLQNDACTGAIPMQLDTIYTLNTSSATSTDDPTNVCSAPFGNGVWYSFTAPTNGMLTLSTCGSDFDTLMQVYTGSCDSLTPFTCADDDGPACAGIQASAQFLVSQGTTYFIAVGGSGGATGNLQIEATMPAPTNDQCSGAIPLSVGVPYTMNTANATTVGDPTPGCQPEFGAGVWFQFTAPSNGPVTISTFGSDLYTALQVYTGACGALTPLICDSTDGPGPEGARARVTFEGTNGETYLILVGGYYGTLKSGNIEIAAEEGMPQNDMCSGAIIMTAGVTYTQRTSSATTNGDPSPACVSASNFGNGVWYTFTPQSNAIVTVSTCGSDFETALQVFTGYCGNWAAVTDGCSHTNWSVCGTNRASASFSAISGVKYYILVGGYNGDAGNLSIQTTLSAPLPNDNCAGAVAMTPGMEYTENTATATSGGDPQFVSNESIGKSVWYSFTPTSNCVVIVSTCDSDFNTALQVCTGTCSSLTAIPDGFNIGNGPACRTNLASVGFLGTAGTEYLICAGGYNSEVGNLSIQATVQPPLPNDQCTGAVAMADGVTYSLNTATATSAGDQMSTCINNYNKSVWYSYNLLATNQVIISTAGSDYQTIVQVYQGSCGQLTPVACGSSSVSFTGGPGTYLIQAGGIPAGSSTATPMTGTLQIQATAVPTVNDQCLGAIPLVLGSNYTVNTTYATSTNEPTPTCGTNFDKGVWYEYTPPYATELTINTCGSDFETGLQVYTGDCSSLVPVACSDGTGSPCGTNRATLTLPVVAGTNYLILASGRDGAFGNLSLVATAPAPTNDLCANPISISEGITYTENTSYATTNGDPPAVNKAVWFSYTPSRAGMLLLSTCGSDFNTAFQVFTGGCGSLSNFIYIDDGGPACASDQASAEFLVAPGTTYLIAAGGGTGGTSGNLSLTATMPIPTNDQCSGAVPMTSGVTYSLYTANATETNDPIPDCQINFGKGVWYTFTPNVSGTVSVSTCGSDFDTVLEVYTGTCGAFTPVICDDDDGPLCSGFAASVSFNGTAGTTYWILVGGYGGAFGNLAIEAQEPPTVNFSQSGTNLVLMWPTNASGFSLEATTNLTPPVFWNTVTGQIIWGSNYVMTNSMSAPQRFYRLKN